MREFGLIGRSLKHSFSVAYFRDKFHAEAIQDCSYSNFELEEIDEVVDLVKKNPNLCGFSVTIPYKQDIMPLLDEISSEAEMVGAVNCVRIINGRMIGYNTDVLGFKSSLEDFLGATTIERALVLGTGGASQAVQYVLSQMGIEYQLVSRDPSKADFTYDNLSCESLFEHHLVVNTTPIGMYPNVDEAPRIPYAYITPSHYLYDLVYNPILTQFLDYGQQRGANICNGTAMLQAQAEAAWQIWNSDKK